MEDLNLTETEMRYFGDLFLCCDEESNGKIPILKATELFRSSNIHNDILKQIMDISVAPVNCASLSHLNRKQFYSSLKLIAAHQTNMAVKPELLCTAVDLPLPRFTWTLNSEASTDLIQLSNSPNDHHHSSKRDRDRSFGGNLAYEPIRVSSNLSDSDVPQTLSHDTTEGVSTDSEIESETMSQRSGSRGRRGKAGSPWSTASESPTPTNSVAERVHPIWEHSATGRGVWPVSTGEEHTQLLGTEEESSDRHSSEEEGEPNDEVWCISDAQARHYAAQFAQLRPDRGMLSGQTARLFFEKSHLPVPDLRKIWQLSDLNKDGMLTLEEFSIAMHLIVLRRNNVRLPETLPLKLAVPLAPLAPSAPLAPVPPVPPAPRTDLPDMFSSGTSADFNFPDVLDGEPPRLDERRSLTPPKVDPPVNNKEWTKFVDSPTSSASSPGPKPVNFDFHKSAVERDPKIFHPVAVRVTPEGGGEGDSCTRREAPPPPPPRPLRQHARSSSLDLTRLKAPPPPPRDDPPAPPPATDARGAFEPYRKPRPDRAERPERPEERTARALQEQNAVLMRVCRALVAELADVTRDREALKLRLESHRP